MSTPRDRDHPDEGFDPSAPDGGGWREPSHLGGTDPAGTDRPAADGPADGPADRPADQPPAWEPPGWNLPPAAPPRPPRGAGGPLLRGGRLGRPRGDSDEVFEYQGDHVGAQGWALHHGWTISDGEGPEDAVLRDLVATAPVRPGKEARPAGVLRGRAGTLELVAFDIVYPAGRSLVPKYAVTAAPLLGEPPVLRLSPARFWRHRTGGLIPVASGNEAFDARWLLLAAEDTPELRRLVEDPAVQGLLLGTDDGDEFWTGAGHLAAVRPDGHRPALLEHHARLLAAIVGALSPGY
jgi:hypothetical protein